LSGAAGAVRRAEPLRHNVLAAELAGLPVDNVAVADIVLVDRDARMRTAQQLGQPGVARFDRQPAQILAVELCSRSKNTAAWS